MRRGIALFLMVLFGLWPLTGTLAASDESRLPACCRRHGAHHCAMALAAMARLKPSKTPVLEAPATCPSFPRHLSGATTPTVALAAAAVRAARMPASATAPRFPAEAAIHRKILPLAGRGPPRFLLS
jgi:4'-phosphopantetheinyl transferase EntD